MIVPPTTRALRGPGERLYTWSFAGTRSTSRDAMLDALALIDGGVAQIGPVDDLAADHEVLADSVFAPCAMDGTCSMMSACAMGDVARVAANRKAVVPLVRSGA